MEIKDYKVVKEKGFISIKKVGGKYIYNLRRFSPLTGEEINPEIDEINITKMESLSKELQSQLNCLNELISDCNNTN